MRIDEQVQTEIDYRIAEARFVQRWVGRPLKQWLFRKRYLAARARLPLFRPTPLALDAAISEHGEDQGRDAAQVKLNR